MDIVIIRKLWKQCQENYLFCEVNWNGFVSEIVVEYGGKYLDSLNNYSWRSQE